MNNKHNSSMNHHHGMYTHAKAKHVKIFDNLIKVGVKLRVFRKKSISESPSGAEQTDCFSSCPQCVRLLIIWLVLESEINGFPTEHEHISPLHTVFQYIFYSASKQLPLILFKGKVVILECVIISDHKIFPDIDSLLGFYSNIINPKWKLSWVKLIVFLYCWDWQ